MRTLFLLYHLYPQLFSQKILSSYVNGEEINILKEIQVPKEVLKKVIGIQVYQKGMRVDGEWFDNKTD